MTIVDIECWSCRKDSSSTCCNWDCVYLNRIMASIVVDKDKEDVLYNLSSRCLKYRVDLHISFGRPKRCFECNKKDINV